MSGFVSAVGLLTRFPVKHPSTTARAAPWFPLVGGLVGALVAIAYAGASLVLPRLPAAILAIACGVLATGALHEDGLADTADAFGAGANRDRTLEILKDPRLGTYGAAALFLSLALRISALANLGAWTALAAGPVAHAAGRASAVSAMAWAPAAEGGGLGAAYGAQLTRLGTALALTITAAIAVGLLGVWGLAGVVIAAGCGIACASAATRRIGGTTGDVLGAAEQLTETGVLLLAVALGDAIPWWRT